MYPLVLHNCWAEHPESLLARMYASIFLGVMLYLYLCRTVPAYLFHQSERGNQLAKVIYEAVEWKGKRMYTCLFMVSFEIPYVLTQVFQIPRIRIGNSGFN